MNKIDEELLEEVKNHDPAPFRTCSTDRLIFKLGDRIKDYADFMDNMHTRLNVAIAHYEEDQDIELCIEEIEEAVKAIEEKGEKCSDQTS